MDVQYTWIQGKYYWPVRSFSRRGDLISIMQKKSIKLRFFSSNIYENECRYPILKGFLYLKL